MRFLEEIIRTTMRNYTSKFIDEYGFCPHDNFIEDIYWRWQYKFFKIKSGHLTTYGMIDLLQECFKEKEAEGFRERAWPL